MQEQLIVTIECPECGAEQEDLDGFGFIFCQQCRYCTHPSADGDDDELYCTVCGQNVTDSV